MNPAFCQIPCPSCERSIECDVFNLNSNEVLSDTSLVLRAQSGDFEAMNIVGRALLSGESEEQAAEGVRMLQTAAATDCNSITAYAIGYALVHGRGVERNPIEGAEWFLKSAHLGLPLALYALGALFISNKHGLKPNAELAVECFRIAAQGGSRCAHRFLADEYRRTSNDPARWQHYEQAASLGCAEAMVNLAANLQPDNPRRMDLVRKAAEAGNAQAERCLAAHYLQGLGVPKDFDIAVSWASRAAAHGNPESIRWMERLGEQHLKKSC